LEITTSVDEEYKMSNYVVKKYSCLEKRSLGLTEVKPHFKQND
jgi:hypothetical protein